MKRYKVKVTPFAKGQMKEIGNYIATQLLNPDAARSTIQAIRKEVKSLAEMPDRVRPIDEEPWGSQGVRKITVRNYYAYYWIEEELSEVHVIAVAYAMRDQTSVLRQIREE